MLRKDLIAAIADEMNIPRDWAGEFVHAYEQVVYNTVNSGEDIKLTDFIKFEIVTDKGGSRYNIHVQEKTYVPPKYKLKIRPLGKLKASIEEQRVSKRERKLYSNPESEGDIDG